MENKSKKELTQYIKKAIANGRERGVDRIVIEDENDALTWLKSPQYGLGERVPLSMLTTEAGTRLVEQLLLRIEYGVIA